MKRIFILLAVIATIFLLGCGETEVTSESVEQISEAIDNEESEILSEEVTDSDESGNLPEETSDSTENEVLTEELDENAESQLAFELQTTDNPKVNVILNLSGTYTDIVGNTNNYVYQIPQFNVDSDSAKQLNQRIVDDLYDVINDEVQTMPTGCSLFCYSVTYEVVEYENIAAIIVSAPYPNDVFFKFAYSYDFSNDKEVTNAELLDMFGWSEDAFIEEACYREKIFFKGQIISIYPDITEDDINLYTSSAVQATTIDLPMYIDTDGGLCVYLPMPSVAGAEWYYTLVRF